MTDLTHTTHLDCDHCGGPAIESPDGMFRDGDGNACMSCGFPGCVHADEEAGVWWGESQELDARCNEPDCEECND